MSVLDRASAAIGRLHGTYLRERGDVLRAAEDDGEGFVGNKRPETEEVGFSGLKIINGIIDEEYLDALDDLEDRVGEYNRMRCMAAPLMQAVTLPIRGAQWRVEPAETGDSVEEEIAEAISDNLFERMTITWDDFLRHALLGVFYGFALFEKVWALEDGEAVWRKFAPRAPDTVYKWMVGEGGGFAGVEQKGYDYDENGNWTYVTSRPIPVEKLLLMSYQQEYGNFEGRGLFRDAYRYFWMLDKFYTLAAIRVERTACPTPVAEYIDATGPKLTEDAEENLQAALGRIRTYESGGIVLPRNVKLGSFEIAGAEVSFLDLIEHTQQQMLRTALAQFLGLGQGENSGAYALSRDASNLFLSSLNGTTSWICDYINRYAIPQRVAYNWGERDAYPKLVCEDIGVRDPAALAQMLATLMGAQLLDRRDEIGEYIREAFELPEMSEDAPAPQQSTKKSDLDEDAPVENVSASVVTFAEGTVPAELADAEDEFRAEGEAILTDMIRQYLSRLEPAVNERKWAEMADVRVPLTGKYRNWLRGYLSRVVELGRDALAAARDGDAVPPIPNELRQWIRAQAESLADYHTSTVAFAVRQTLMNHVTDGMSVEAALRNALAVGNVTVNRQVGEDLLAASEIAVEKLQED